MLVLSIIIIVYSIKKGKKLHREYKIRYRQMPKHNQFLLSQNMSNYNEYDIMQHIVIFKNSPITLRSVKTRRQEDFW